MTDVPGPEGLLDQPSRGRGLPPLELTDWERGYLAGLLEIESEKNRHWVHVFGRSWVDAPRCEAAAKMQDDLAAKILGK
jgi:hypothetical protein